MKRRRRGREKTKTERFLQSFFASNTFPLGSFWCLRQACQHRQQRKKKGGKWNLEVPGWTYIGVHKRKKRDARTKGAETDYTVSHREKPVHREISLVFPSTARPLGWIPTVEKKKKKTHRLRIECWRFMGQRKPSYRSRVKPLANICTVYVKKRQLVSSVNISTIHVSARVSIY